MISDEEEIDIDNYKEIKSIKELKIDLKDFAADQIDAQKKALLTITSGDGEVGDTSLAADVGFENLVLGNAESSDAEAQNTVDNPS